MKVLVTGRGKSGSWIIRGEELGNAIGATVVPNASDIKGFDLAVVVKRPRSDMVERLRQRGVPWVWDVVDAWPQPDGNNWDRESCLSWLRREVDNTKPNAFVAATAAMGEDLMAFGKPMLVLPHHARPGQRRNPIRPVVRTVGYEGGEQYLGRWREVLDRETSKRGWSFVLNPQSLSDVDIVVAVREQVGYAPRHWKSNVKLANAQGTGTPCITNRERGYLETCNGHSYLADTESELSAAMELLTPYDARLQYSRELLDNAPLLPDLANKYRAWLDGLSF